jgi:hypothetical protein
VTVKVHFCVLVSRDKCLTEAEIETQFDVYREALLANDQYYGTITISSDDHPDVVIDDEVWATVQNLCFLAAPDLIAGKSVEIPYFRYGSSLKLTVEGDYVRFAGEFIPTVQVPRRELLWELYACGLRYIDFLRKLGQLDPNFMITAQNLTQQAGMAKEAIARAGPGG